MPRLDLLRRPQPFLGILATAGGWFLSHQIGSESVFDACKSRGGGFVAVVSLLGMIVAAAGGLYCRTAWRAHPGSGRGLLGALGALLALLAIFAMLLQLFAGLILPQCVA